MAGVGAERQVQPLHHAAVVASAQSITSGALTDSQRGGVLTLRTGDGRTTRLRRVESRSA